VGNLHSERSAIEKRRRRSSRVSRWPPGATSIGIIGYAELLCENADAFGLAAAPGSRGAAVHEMIFGHARGCESYMQRVQRLKLQ